MTFGRLTLALALVLFSYVLGSIPFAYLVGRIKNRDLREVGNGRIGTMATVRRLGLGWGILVALIDAGKGAVAVALPLVLGLPLIVVSLAGLAAVVGHDWSVFMRFKGGRGAATTYGVLAVLMFWQLIIGMVVAGAVYLLSHRTTLAFGMMLMVLPLILWAGIELRVLPPLSWAPEVSPIVLIYPPLLFIPMLLKRPMNEPYPQQ